MNMQHQLETFQRTHDDWNGNPLVVDGVLGPRTAWALAVDQLPAPRRNLVLMSTRQSGSPSYSADLLAGKGKVAFVCSVLAECGVAYRARDSVDGLLDQFDEPHEPHPGDLAGYSGSGPVGVVIGTDADGVATAEVDGVWFRPWGGPGAGLVFRDVLRPVGFRVVAPAGLTRARVRTR